MKSSKLLNRRSKASKQFIVYILILFFIIIANFPIIWGFITSLKPDTEIYSRTLILFPSNPTLKHYWDLLTTTGFLTYYTNSLIVTFTSVALSIILSALAAYGLTRFSFRGRDAISILILLTYMFPGIVLVIPLYVIFVRIGLDNTLWSLIIMYTAMSVPLCTWILRSFFKGIPIDLEEAAYVDGASKMYTFLHVVIPLAAPGIITTAVFAFYVAWTEYLFSYIFISTDALRTLPVGIMYLFAAHGILYGMLMAASVLVVIPALILFIVVQKYLILGIGAGAIKG